MRKRAQNSNKQFLIGTAAMAFAVSAVVVLFLLLCSRHVSKQPTLFKDIYQIEFTKGFVQDSALVYLNDSVLWDGIIPSDTTKLRIHRFADENTLIVSRSANDVVSIFNVEKKAGRLVLQKENGIVSMTLLGW